MNWTRLLPDLYLGSCPASAQDVLDISELGVGVVVNLQLLDDIEAHSLTWADLTAEYDALDVTFVHVPMDDNEPESVRTNLTRAVESIHAHLEDGWAVYLHCTSGVNRAPTVAIGYLAMHAEMNLEEAYEHVTTRRACMPFFEVLEAWFERDDSEE